MHVTTRSTNRISRFHGLLVEGADAQTPEAPKKHTMFVVKPQDSELPLLAMTPMAWYWLSGRAMEFEIANSHTAHVASQQNTKQHLKQSTKAAR
jgi:hypothetical protein